MQSKFEYGANQVIIFMVIAASVMLVGLSLFMSSLNSLDKTYVWLWLRSELFSAIETGIGFNVHWRDNYGYHSDSAQNVAHWEWLNDHIYHLLTSQKKQLLLAITIGVVIWAGIAFYINRSFLRQLPFNLESGKQLVNEFVYRAEVGKNASDLSIGNVPWIKNAEIQQMLIIGNSGTGKSQLINQLLTQIRSRGDMAIIFDSKLDFVRDFYQSEDTLLSPFDQRAPAWNVWRDINNMTEAEAFAEAIIKDNGQDPFWAKGARMVLVAAIKKSRQQKLSFEQMLEKLLKTELDTLKDFFAQTEVASDFSNEKTISGVLTELKVSARNLNYLQRVEGKDFSLKAWLNEGLLQSSKPWLFLPLPEQLKAVGAPIITAQLELLANHILSLETDNSRRIWFVVDELPKLGKMPVLTRILAEGRGYGVAGVIGIQNMPQIKDIYGDNGANALAGQCSSMVAFRTADPATAGYVSARLGKHLRKEKNTSFSTSHSASGKGGNNSESISIVERPLVSASEIMELPDLTAILSVKELSPVKINIQFTPPTTNNASLQLRRLPKFDDLEQNAITPVSTEKWSF